MNQVSQFSVVESVIRNTNVVKFLFASLETIKFLAQFKIIFNFASRFLLL